MPKTPSWSSSQPPKFLSLNHVVKFLFQTELLDTESLTLRLFLVNLKDMLSWSYNGIKVDRDVSNYFKSLKFFRSFACECQVFISRFHLLQCKRQKNWIGRVDYQKARDKVSLYVERQSESLTHLLMVYWTFCSDDETAEKLKTYHFI